MEVAYHIPFSSPEAYHGLSGMWCSTLAVGEKKSLFWLGGRSAWVIHLLSQHRVQLQWSEGAHGKEPQEAQHSPAHPCTSPPTWKKTLQKGARFKLSPSSSYGDRLGAEESMGRWPGAKVLQAMGTANLCYLMGQLLYSCAKPSSSENLLTNFHTVQELLAIKSLRAQDWSPFSLGSNVRSAPHLVRLICLAMPPLLQL